MRLVKRHWRKNKKTGRKEYVGVPRNRFVRNRRTGEKYYYGESRRFRGSPRSK